MPTKTKNAKTTIDRIEFDAGPGSANWQHVRWLPPGSPWVCAITEPATPAFAEAAQTDPSWKGDPKFAVTPDRRPGHHGEIVMKVTRGLPGQRQRYLRKLTPAELAVFLAFEQTEPGSKARSQKVKRTTVTLDMAEFIPDPGWKPCTSRTTPAKPRQSPPRAAATGPEKERRAYRHQRARNVDALRAVVQQLGAVPA